MRFEKDESKIRKDIETGITRCMNAAFLNCTPNTPQEPDYVSELVNGLPEDLYKTLSVYAPGYRFAVSGVFCHQKPMALLETGGKVELGDLLIVYIEENIEAVLKSNALLLQAKRTNKVPYVVHYDERNQLRLYEEWPKFELSRAGDYNGIVIDVQPKTLNSGAQDVKFRSPVFASSIAI